MAVGRWNKTFEQKLLVIPTTSATMFLHGLLLGIVSRWHRGILETFVAHPSIVLRPVFTHFTFASSTKWCKGSPKEEEEEEDEAGGEKARGEAEEPFIFFSVKFPKFNVGASTLGSFIYCLSMTQIAGWENIFRFRPTDRDSLLPALLSVYSSIPFILVPIIGLILTLCSPLHNCCSSYFSLPKVEFGALVPSNPYSHYLLNANGKPMFVPEDGEVKREKTEMAKDEEVKTIGNQDDEIVKLVTTS